MNDLISPAAAEAQRRIHATFYQSSKFAVSEPQNVGADVSSAEGNRGRDVRSPGWKPREPLGRSGGNAAWCCVTSRSRRRKEGKVSPGTRCSSCAERWWVVVAGGGSWWGCWWERGGGVESFAHLSVNKAHLYWAKGAGTAEPPPPPCAA